MRVSRAFAAASTGARAKFKEPVDARTLAWADHAFNGFATCWRHLASLRANPAVIQRPRDEINSGRGSDDRSAHVNFLDRDVPADVGRVLRREVTPWNGWRAFLQTEGSKPGGFDGLLGEEERVSTLRISTSACLNLEWIDHRHLENLRWSPRSTSAQRDGAI